MKNSTEKSLLLRISKGLNQNPIIAILYLFMLGISSNSFGQILGVEAAIPFNNNINARLETGFYGAASTNNNPPDHTGLGTHYWVSRHFNPVPNAPADNYQLQIASTFTLNDRIYFRKIAQGDGSDGTNPWIEFATRGANAFNGNQYATTSFEAPSLIAGSSGSKQLLSGANGWNYLDVTGSAAWILRLKNLNNHPAIVVQADGDVGIGTNVAFTGYRLSVNGKIRCEELQVIVDVPADYVFEPEYKLMPLKEVAHFVQENKHLPNVPSAADIKEKGWNVGEMSNNLLEKVEELTLYMIDLKKENEQLKSRIETLENQR